MGSIPFDLPPLPWDAPMASLSASVGLPPDQLKFTICMVLAIPVGFLFYAVTPDPFTAGKKKESAIAQRHMLCLLIGMAFMLFMFGYDALHSLISSTVALIMLRVVPTSQVHIWVSIWAMGYLLGCHVHRMRVAYLGWELDFTNPQLLLTQKLMNIAFQLYDGSRKASELSEDQNKRKLPLPPTFLEYYGYIYSLHTLLGGPSTDYNDYICWIDGSRLASKTPSRSWAVIKKILGGIFCVICFVVIGGHFPVGNVAKPEFLAQHSPFYVFFYVNWALYLMRHRYYFAWVLSDAACNAAGFGYNGDDKDGNPKWDGVLNIQYVAVELATNYRSAMTGWNICTSNWLRRCIYDRVPANGPRTAATFFVSALWHGFYPGYFLCFLTCALVNETARIMRRHVRPLFIPDGKTDTTLLANVYHFLTWFTTLSFLNYCAVPFVVLSLERSLTYWMYWYFAPHFIALGAYFLVPILLRQPKAAALKETKRE